MDAINFRKIVKNSDGFLAARVEPMVRMLATVKNSDRKQRCQAAKQWQVNLDETLVKDLAEETRGMTALAQTYVSDACQGCSTHGTVKIMRNLAVQRYMFKAVGDVLSIIQDCGVQGVDVSDDKALVNTCIDQLDAAYTRVRNALCRRLESMESLIPELKTVFEI